MWIYLDKILIELFHRIDVMNQDFLNLHIYEIDQLIFEYNFPIQLHELINHAVKHLELFQV